MTGRQHTRSASRVPCGCHLREGLPPGRDALVASSRCGRAIRRLALCAGVTCALLLGTAVQARAEALSTMQLNEKIEQWRNAEQEPPPLTYIVEGRFAASSSERVRL